LTLGAAVLTNTALFSKRRRPDPRGPSQGGGAAGFRASCSVPRPLGAVTEERRMKMRPLHDRIVVKRIDEDEKTKGGIIIPDTAKEKPQQGRVVAVGNGKLLEDGSVRPLDVHKGDKVLFGKYSGSEFVIDGEEHLIIREEDVLGVLE
jgi:chaperonin GroES